MWIDVNEKLPDINQEVLVVIENEGNPEITKSYYDEMYDTWDDDNNKIKKPRWYYDGEPIYCTSWFQEVTFWMPLPALPGRYS